MTFGKLLLSFILASPFWFIFYRLSGHLLFKFGFKRIGHKWVAMSIAEDFGCAVKTREWLRDNCPYECGACPNCRIWTCGAYCRLQKQ